ncbi:MAG: hypothetical protein ACTSSG_10495 [Candidatus Heimdallarchaeaceae archaeon]
MLNNLLDDTTIPIIEKILRENLCIQEGEKLAIATDFPVQEDLLIRPSYILEEVIKRNFLAKKVYEISKKIFPEQEITFLTYPCPWEQFSILDKEIVRGFLENDIVFILSAFSISNNFMLEELERTSTRLATSPGIEETSFLPGGALDVDYQKLEKECMLLYNKCKNAKEIKIYTKYGTNLVIKPNHQRIFYESGIISYPGKFSNLPAGEVTMFLSNSEGEYVVPKGWIEGVQEDLILQIKDSKIVELKGEETRKRKLEELLGGELPHQVLRLAVGLNKNAKNPFNNLELEKMRGVTNLAVRLKKQNINPFDTSTFTGHFPSPRIDLEIDGELVFNKGKFLLE